MLNGARQGLAQRDEEAVLKYELAPMGLDYVYAYFAPAFAVGGLTPTFVSLTHGAEFGHRPPDEAVMEGPLAGLLAPGCPIPPWQEVCGNNGQGHRAGTHAG